MTKAAKQSRILHRTCTTPGEAREVAFGLNMQGNATIIEQQGRYYNVYVIGPAARPPLNGHKPKPRPRAVKRAWTFGDTLVVWTLFCFLIYFLVKIYSK